ncbi:unnamed protein product, partial [Nesidiocoris tenuis]
MAFGHVRATASLQLLNCERGIESGGYRRKQFDSLTGLRAEAAAIEPVAREGSNQPKWLAPVPAVRISPIRKRQAAVPPVSTLPHFRNELPTPLAAIPGRQCRAVPRPPPAAVRIRE